MREMISATVRPELFEAIIYSSKGRSFWLYFPLVGACTVFTVAKAFLVSDPGPPHSDQSDAVSVSDLVSDSGASFL